MDAASRTQRNQFQTDLSTVVQIAADAVTAKTRKANAAYFGKWVGFCSSLGHQPTLPRIPRREDKLCYMLVFGHRYRTNHSVRAGAVSKALAAVGQGLADLGVHDPRKPLANSSRLDPLLQAYLKKLSDDDDPTNRSYPANLTIVKHTKEVLDTDHHLEGILNSVAIDLIIVAFYWLLRPSEYLGSDTDLRSQAFLFRDISLTIDGRTLSAPNTPLNDELVMRVSHASLTFSDQKNAVRGESVGHSANDDPFFCPAKSLARIALRLQQANASHTTPIHAHYNNHPSRRRWYYLQPKHITAALRHSAQSLQPSTGIDFRLLSARSLRPGGATALLCAGVDKDHIQLLGRWQSDAVFRYLRIQASLRNLSQQMLEHGEYTFSPDAFRAGGLPNQAPASMKQILAHTELATDL